MLTKEAQIEVDAASEKAKEIQTKLELTDTVGFDFDRFFKSVKSVYNKDIYLLFNDFNSKEIKSLNVPNTADGFTINIKKDNKTYIIIINKNMPANRQRFTMAHEIGHIFLDHNLDEIRTRASEEIIHKQCGDNDPNSKYFIEEKAANAFAAELLMPEVQIKLLFSHKKYGFDDLSKAFGVSVDSVILRLKTLKLISW
jgi:Zn-dependent peptidase ImmA (M78 family)